jgi:hypothetical protein
MTIHITKANLHGRKWLLICIGNPRCPVPARQVRNNVRVPRMCQVGNRLSPDDYHVIACLCQERTVVKDVPIVVANEDELVEEVEDIIEAVGVQDQVVEVPVLLDEEELEMVEEPYYPYQLTRYYQNALVRFQEAFEERMNETYERERIIFEQQQQQQYNDALIIEGEQQEQQQQQQIINLPDIVVEEEENGNNNDIIINNIPGDDYEDDINNNDIIINEADIDVVDDDDNDNNNIIINNNIDERDDDGNAENYNNVIIYIYEDDDDDGVDDDEVFNNIIINHDGVNDLFIEEDNEVGVNLNDNVEEDNDEEIAVVVVEEEVIGIEHQVDEEERQQHVINYAINLPVLNTALTGHREQRNQVGLVDLHDRKQFDDTARALACLYATYLMGWKENMPRRQKEQMALAACTLVCYDLGYKVITGKFGLATWIKQFKASVLNTSALNMFKSKHRGSTSHTNRVETQHPTYLHYLYRRATSIIGNDATFAEVASQMNLLSTVDERPTMNLNKWSLLRWFKKHKGKERRAVFSNC